MAQGRGSVAMLVLLLLGFYAALSFAREAPHILLPTQGDLVQLDGEICCDHCICPRIWPRDLCRCLDVYTNSCPSWCKSCSCVFGECACSDNLGGVCPRLCS